MKIVIVEVNIYALSSIKDLHVILLEFECVKDQQQKHEKCVLCVTL
jgi:hypothetical protein